MELFETINTRYSAKNLKTDAVPRDMLEKILDAGNHAPNHYRVRPWRFFVLSGGARNKLGDGAVVEEQVAVCGQGYHDRDIFVIAGLFGLGKVHRDLAGADEGGGGEDDDEQHEHHVDQRNDVDLINLAFHVAPYRSSAVR